MKKKVVFISNLSWNLYNFRLSLMHAIRNEGFEVIAIAPYDRYSQKIIDEGFEFHDISMNAQGVNPLEDLKTTYEFYKLFKKISPDVLCQYTIKPNIYGSLIASLLKIKMVNNIAGLGTLFIQESPVTKVAKVLYKLSQRKADQVFFQNRDDFDFFVETGIVNSNKCDILPGSGVDTNRFKPIYKEKSEKIRFLLISRMIWEKGIGEYVSAAREIKKTHPNVEFCLLGFLDVQNPGAITRNELNEWIDEGIINYLGVTDNVDEVIQTADCVVLPSYYREGTPKVLLESGSCGKPIITTDNVGCRDVVDDGVNGYICKPRSSEDLKLKMENFLNLSYEERVTMGLRSRAKIKHEYDEKIVINKYIEAIIGMQRPELVKKDYEEKLVRNKYIDTNIALQK